MHNRWNRYRQWPAVAPHVSVIIRTQANKARCELLARAVRSVLSQEGVAATLIVVVNGEAPEPAVIDWLHGDARIDVVMLAKTDKAQATAVGRARVQSPFFTYLDDDDELLPQSLRLRARFLCAHPRVDCFVTNGEYVSTAERRRVFRDINVYARDPLGAIVGGANWLASCGGTFRTATVSQRFFDDTTRHCEFRVIAFRVASELTLAFSDEQTFRLWDLPDSQHRLPTHVDLEYQIYEVMARWNKDPALTGKLKRARIASFHKACALHRLAGDFPRAWANHWKSLASPYGLKYLPYTALLLARHRGPVHGLMQTLGLGKTKIS